MREDFSTYLRLDLLPESFNGIQFRTIRWEKLPLDIPWNPERFGFMKLPIVKQEHSGAFSALLCHGIHIDLKTRGVHRGPLQKKGFTSHRLDRSIQLGTCKEIVKVAPGLDSL